MAQFDSYADSPFQIKTEGQGVTIRFDRTGPTTGRISWNIPIPTRGCSTDNQAFNGIIVTLDTTHTSRAKVPVDTTKYTADPTGDVLLHAGDKIDTSLVIGAFYNDKVTTFFDVSGLDEETVYYISGFAVDSVLRYHTEGVHAYSQNYANANKTDSTKGYQLVDLTDGITLGSTTGLVLGELYDFLLMVDGKEYPQIEIDGTAAQTYQQLIDAINAKILLIESPFTSAISPNLDQLFFESVKELLYKWNGSEHDLIPAIVDAVAPVTPVLNDYWYNSTSNVLSQWDGTIWNPVVFTMVPLTPLLNMLWYDLSTSTLREWDGDNWVESTPIAVADLNDDGDLRIMSTTIGTVSTIEILDGFLFETLTAFYKILDVIPGTDGVTGISMYDEVGVGDDGTTDERRELMDSIRAQLGYPVVEVELTSYQLDTAITGALESLRKRSGIAYRRGFFFLNVKRNEQNMLLTDKTVGFNKIVTINEISRISSAFLSAAYGGGLYGQIALQQLYTMGTFDLLSYHLVGQYIETMEDLFATRVMYQWNENTRRLDIMQVFAKDERVLLDVTVERSEQELMTDRWTKSWIERYASAQARMILAEIRGKYASLPGAGGGVALNAAELISRADTDMEDCYRQIDDFITEQPEEYGMGSTFVLG